jgi:hypothetical protein
LQKSEEKIKNNLYTGRRLAEHWGCGSRASWDALGCRRRRCGRAGRDRSDRERGRTAYELKRERESDGVLEREREGERERERERVCVGPSERDLHREGEEEGRRPGERERERVSL